MNVKEYENWYAHIFKNCNYSKSLNDKLTVCYLSDHKYCCFEQCEKRG